MRALVNDFMAQNISMPDDARERVLLTRKVKIFTHQTRRRTRQTLLTPLQQHLTVNSLFHHALMMSVVTPTKYERKLKAHATQNKAAILSDKIDSQNNFSYVFKPQKSPQR
jgi:hypothetical protein